MKQPVSVCFAWLTCFLLQCWRGWIVFSLLFESCREYCANGIDQPVSVHFGLIELLRAAMLIWMDLLCFAWLTRFLLRCWFGCIFFLLFWIMRWILCEWNWAGGKYFICPIDSLLAAMLTRIDLLPFVFESCGKYCGNGMEQKVSI